MSYCRHCMVSKDNYGLITYGTHHAAISGIFKIQSPFKEACHEQLLTPKKYQIQTKDARICVENVIGYSFSFPSNFLPRNVHTLNFNFDTLEDTELLNCNAKR